MGLKLQFDNFFFNLIWHFNFFLLYENYFNIRSFINLKFLHFNLTFKFLVDTILIFNFFICVINLKLY